MQGEETAAAVWNFDGAELNLLFELKESVHIHLNNWNLEECYWALRKLRMELDAKLKDGGDTKEGSKESEKGEVDRLMKELEEARTTFISNKQTNESLGNFYSLLENFYMYLCRLMKKHKLYFREGDDPSLAILRR